MVECTKYSLEIPNTCFQVGKILACSLRTIFYAKQLGKRQLSNSYLSVGFSVWWALQFFKTN